jgi:hypothetical protein
MGTLILRCNNHRGNRLEVIEGTDGRYYIKPCYLCKAVAAVKMKREIRKRLIETLEEGVIPCQT